MARSRRVLHPRHKMAAIVSRLQLMLFRTGRPGYPRKGHLVDVFPDWYICMLILENDDRDRHGTMSIQKLAKLTGISRSAIRERIRLLETHGLIKHIGRDGYVCNPDFFINAPAKIFARLRDVIRAANAEAKKIKLV